MSNVEIVEETLIDRLKQVIKIYYGSQKNLAKELNISSSNMSEWWAGRSKPRAETLQQICEKTGVSMDWLVLGRKEPYVGETLFEQTFNESKKFAEKNNIPFNAMYLLGIQRIVIAERRMNSSVTFEQIFKKYKEIILAFRKNSTS